MKCRKDIKGRKIWVDDNNSHNTRLPYIGNGAYILPILRGIPLNIQPTVLPTHLHEIFRCDARCSNYLGAPRFLTYT